MNIGDLKGGKKFRLVSYKTGQALTVVFTKLATSITPNGDEEISRMESFQEEFNGEILPSREILTLPEAFTVRDDDGLLYPMPTFMKVELAA